MWQPEKKPECWWGTAHEIRFYAKGLEDSVELLGLELAVHSKKDMQRAHRIMIEYAAALTKRILQMDLPDQMADTIMGAVRGR